MSETQIEITDLGIPVVLAALCNNTLPLGMGVMNSKAMDKITEDDCLAEVKGRKEDFAKYSEDGEKENIRFDYLFGRPIKVGFVTQGEKVFLERSDLYDRDSPTTVAKVLEGLRA